MNYRISRSFRLIIRKYRLLRNIPDMNRNIQCKIAQLSCTGKTINRQLMIVLAEILLMINFGW